MAIRNILFDLDDTLIVEGASADAAFFATCYKPEPDGSTTADFNRLKYKTGEKK